MPNAPSGTVTFLFTDIEGSTRRWEEQWEVMSSALALARHDALLRQIIEQHRGYVFKTIGDAFCAAFPAAPQALDAALHAQHLLTQQPWPESTGPIRVRMALHTGTAEERSGDYFGPPVNHVARLLSAGHGGQILLSLPTQELVRDALPAGVELRDMGERRLKDLTRSERVFQVIAPDLPSEFPPLKTLDVRPNNLPAQPTSLIGREKELAVASALLRRPEVRLVTFTGPGGTGKTRLGLQVAAGIVDEFEHGVWFVNLAPISDPTLVASTIALALNVQETAGRSHVESLKDYLREKELLLLLDNFEQVIDAAPLFGELTQSAHHLKVLVTSREVLHVYGEHEFPVPPLTSPDPKHLPTAGAHLVSALSQYEAVRLFIDRALAVKPDFSVTHDNAPAVAEICYRLDGLPLAIELAAARIKFLPPQALLSRLQSRLKLLTGGARDLPARQQTLRGAIEWSYYLLAEGEKRLFRRAFRIASSMVNLAAMPYREGDYAAARHLYKESLHRFHELGLPQLVAESLAGFALLAGVAGDAERVARLAGAAEALAPPLYLKGEFADPAAYNDVLEAARAQLSEEEWEAAWQEGRAMSMEEAVTYALEETSDA